METKIPIFRKFVIQNFPYIEEDFDALTDYQLYSKVVEYLNKCIKATNQTVELMATLQEYVDHYFDNLDVQDEINNKLEEMAQSGELTDIIAQYLGLAGVLAYDTISDMVSADNLADGSICRVLGNTNYKNGDGAYYKIRQLINTDVVDGYHLVAITNAPTLVAERITDIDHLPFYAYYLYSSTTTNFGDSTVYLGEKNIIVDFGNDNHTTNDFLTAKGVTKIDASKFTSDAALDLGLLPSAVKGEDGLEAMYGLLMTFIKRGGHAIHINVFDAETLRAAQEEPEKYSDLQIRVCGWNVLFNNINKEEQDGFIRQAEGLV